MLIFALQVAGQLVKVNSPNLDLCPPASTVQLLANANTVKSCRNMLLKAHIRLAEAE